MTVNTIDELDMTSETVLMDEHKEVSRVSQSPYTINVSESETLTEFEIEGVRVSSGVKNSLEQGTGEDQKAVIEGGYEKSCTDSVASTSHDFSFSESEVQKDENEVTKVELLTESSIEVSEVGREGKITEIEQEEVLNSRKDVLLNDDGHGEHENPFSLEKNQQMGVFSDAGNCKEIAGLSVNKDETFRENTTSEEVENQEKVSQVDGESLYPVKVGLDSVVELIDHAGPCPDNNAEEGEEIEASGNLKDEDQNTGSCDAEIATRLEEKNQIMDDMTEIKEADDFEKLGGNQIMRSQVCEIPISQCDDPSFDSLNVGSNLCPNKDGDKVVETLNDPHIEEAEIEEIKSDFLVSDLVWAKVNSHPWWPAQIFDPQDSSKLAKRHRKKYRHRYLVAYFGDQTFAWNIASSLKPFEPHFSQMEKQSNLEPFHDAVDSALDEISRRVQLGLACSCTPDEAYDEIKTQIIKNAGIRAESSRRNGVDKKFSVASFEPSKLIKYIKALALNPHCGIGDRLEFVVSRAQLTAFYRLRGYSRLPEFLSFGGLLVNEGEDPSLIVENEEEQDSPVKRKLTSEDKVYRKRRKVSDDNNLNLTMKDRSLLEITGKESGSSRSSFDYLGNNDLTGKTKKEKLSSPKNENTVSRSPITFKVGDSIRRIASQLKGSSPILCPSDERRRRKTATPKEYSSSDEMLSLNHLAARNIAKGSRKKKASQTKTDGGKAGARSRKSSNSKPTVKSFDTFDYEDMSDGITNDSSEEPSSRKRQKKSNSKCKTPAKKEEGSSDEPETNLRLNSSEISKEYRPEVPIEINSSKLVAEELIDRANGISANDPTALILNFRDADSIPLKTELNKIFSRFGPLKESDTELFRKKKSAKVVFKKRNDAEVAFSSAGKYSIFGPALTSYQLIYLQAKPSEN